MATINPVLSHNQRAPKAMRTNDAQRKYIDFEELESRFHNPDMKYAPFYWIFSDVALKKEKSEAVQLLVSEAIKQRANPGYLFSCLKERDKPAFLSDEYMDVFEDALKIAEENKTAFSFCDEWTWPTGQAGSNLLDKHPELRAETLHHEVREVMCGQTVHIQESFFTVVAQCEKAKNNGWEHNAPILSSTLDIISYGEAVDWEVPPQTGYWRIYRFQKVPRDLPERWGQCNVNYLDRRLPEAFIEMAHKPYEERFSEHFGKTIPGFFTDHEGDYGWKLAWSDDFENEYQQKKERDIRLWMPLMLHKDVEGKWAKARWDWYDVVSDLHANNFFKGVSDWAAERGLYQTIHFWEENLIMQAVCTGSLFKAQRAVTLPGVDCLGDLGLWVRFFKETQSVCEFDGKRFMAECFGAKGWDMSPVLMKKVANAMTSWGVSHIIPASMAIDRDLRNVVYPHELYGLPFWRYLHHWNDFVRRTSYINSHGRLMADVLVIYPIDSVWAAAGGDIFNAKIQNLLGVGDLINGWRDHKALTEQEAVKATDNGDYIDHVEEVYTNIIKDLDSMNVEFLIADSEYIQAMDVSSEGRLLKDDFSFKAVVLPPVFILSRDVAEKLLTFARQGGEVYIMGEPPTGSPGQGLDDPVLKETMDKLLSLPTVYRAEKSLISYCKPESGLVPKVEFINGEFPLLLQHRQVDGRDFYWLANNTDNKQSAEIKFRGAIGGNSIWNCETGECKPVASISTDGDSITSLVFEPYEGYWLVFDKKAEPLATVPDEKQKHALQTTEINSQWKVYVDLGNQPPVPYPGFIQDLPEAILRENGGIEDSLKWWSEWGVTKFSGFVTYENCFVLPDTSIWLTLSLGKVSHSVEVWLNGRFVGSRLWPAFEFDLSTFAVKGENKLKIIVGNLQCNAAPSQGGFFKDREKPESYEAGLIGPVRIATTS